MHDSEQQVYSKEGGMECSHLKTGKNEDLWWCLLTGCRKAREAMGSLGLNAHET